MVSNILFPIPFFGFSDFDQMLDLGQISKFKDPLDYTAPGSPKLKLPKLHNFKTYNFQKIFFLEFLCF